MGPRKYVPPAGQIGNFPPGKYGSKSLSWGTDARALPCTSAQRFLASAIAQRLMSMQVLMDRVVRALMISGMTTAASTPSIAIIMTILIESRSFIDCSSDGIAHASLEMVKYDHVRRNRRNALV